MAVTGEEADGVAEGFGRSALLVAAARAVETCRPDALARDEYAEHFVRAVPACVDRPLRPDQVTGGEADPLRGKAGLLLQAPDLGVRRLSAPADRCRRASVVLLGAGLDGPVRTACHGRAAAPSSRSIRKRSSASNSALRGLDGLDARAPDPGPDGSPSPPTCARARSGPCWHAGVCTPFHFTHRLGRSPRPETQDAPAANRWIFATRPGP